MSVNWSFNAADRLCEVNVTVDVDGQPEGAVLSGCGVGSRLVLTCAHSVGAGFPPLTFAQVVVRANGTRAEASSKATSVFVSHERDVRLLLLDDPLWGGLRPARWGTINGAADMKGQLWGYPWASVRGSGDSGYAAEATIKGGMPRAEHRSLVTDLDPRPEPGGGAPVAGWLGFSGGPVTAGDCLVGMLQAVDGSYEALSMITAAAMLAAVDEASGETLRATIWHHIAGEVVASNEGLLVPGPIRAIGGTGGDRGARLEPPVLPPIHEGRLRPMAALQYRHAVVPYVDGDPVVDDPDAPSPSASVSGNPPAPDTAEARLDRFLLTGDRFRATVLTGSGGIGKSRAAQELMVRAAAEGWLVGLLRAGDRRAWVDGGQGLDNNLLVVVDYPEERPGAVGEWMQWALAAANDGLFQVRLVLLSRHQRAFGRALVEDTALEADDLESLGRKGLGDQRRLRDLAAQRFQSLGLISDQPEDGGQSRSNFETTLAVVGSAFVGGTGDAQVVDRLIARESEFWQTHLVPRGSPSHPIDPAVAEEVERGLRTAVAEPVKRFV